MTEPANIESRDVRITLRGLSHHAVVWGTGPKTVILLHGWLDLARLFDKLAARLAGPDLTLIALDFRGHGDSQHAPASNGYAHPDYVADVHALVEEVAPKGQVALVAHSMGGMVAQFFAGAFPERVSHLCAIEAFGPPFMQPELSVTRLRGYVEDVRSLGARPARRYASLEEAAARVVAKHPRIQMDDALHYARHGTEKVGEGAEAGWQWKFDPRLHARGPLAFFEPGWLPFLAKITAPVLVVEGGDGFVLAEPEWSRRFGQLARGERLLVPGAAHHVHLDAPDAVARGVRELLAR